MLDGGEREEEAMGERRYDKIPMICQSEYIIAPFGLFTTQDIYPTDWSDAPHNNPIWGCGGL